MTRMTIVTTMHTCGVRARWHQQLGDDDDDGAGTARSVPSITKVAEPQPQPAVGGLL